MTQPVNPSTGLPFYATGEAPPAAPAPPPQADALLKNKDGEIYKVPAANVAKALGGGWSQLTPEEAHKNAIEQEEKAKGIPGSLAEAGGSFINQALLGVPGAIQSHTDTPEEAADCEIREQYHSGARILGGAAGMGASLFAGGALFKGAEVAGEAAGNIAEHLLSPAEQLAKAGLGVKLASTTANMATQGAIMAAPQAIVHAAFGDPKEAAETLLWGIGAGAVIGGGAELLGAGSGKVANFAGDLLEGGARSVGGGSTALGGEGGKLDQFANTSALKAVGFQKTQLNKLSETQMQDLGDFVHEKGLIEPGMTRQDIGDRIEALHDTVGKKMGDTISALDGAMEKTGVVKVPGQPDVSIPMTDLAIKPMDFAQRLARELDTPELRMPMNADMAKAVETVIQSAAKLPTKTVNGVDVVPWQDAQDFLSSLRRRSTKAIENVQSGGGVKGLQAVTPLDEAKNAAYHVAKTYVHEAADRFAIASEQPDLVGSLQSAKKDYAMLSQLEKGAANLDRQQAANKMIGLTDEVRMAGGGLLGNAATGAGAAIGGAIGGPAGAMAGGFLGRTVGIPLTYMAKKWGEDKGLVLLSALAKRAAKEGPEVFSAVLASEGAKRVAQTMNGVGDTVRRMAVEGIEATAPKSMEHMQHLLGGPGSTTGLSNNQQYEKLGKRLTELQSNPAALAQVTGPLSSAFQSTDPKVADAYQAQMAAAVAYLHGALPKPPGPPLPFAPQTWAPSPQEKLFFHDKAEILANPMNAMKHMARGTLSDAHLDSLQSNYPTLFAKMRATIVQFHAEHPNVRLPAQERESVGKFMGAPLSPLSQPQAIVALQSNYQQKPNGQQANPGGKMPKGKIKDRPSAGSAFEATTGASPEGA